MVAQQQNTLPMSHYLSVHMSCSVNATGAKYTALLSQKVVTAYLESKQLLPFDFAQ